MTHCHPRSEAYVKSTHRAALRREFANSLLVRFLPLVLCLLCARPGLVHAENSWPQISFPDGYEELLASPIPHWTKIPADQRLNAARALLNQNRLALAGLILADEDLTPRYRAVALRARLALMAGDIDTSRTLLTAYDQTLPPAPPKSQYTAKSFHKEDEQDALNLASLMRSKAWFGWAAGKVTHWATIHPDWPALAIERIRWTEILEGRKAAEERLSSLSQRYGSLSFHVAKARLLSQWNDKAAALSALLDARALATDASEILAISELLKELGASDLSQTLLAIYLEHSQTLTEALPYLPRLGTPNKKQKATLNRLDPDQESPTLAVWFAQHKERERAERWLKDHATQTSPPDANELLTLRALAQSTQEAQALQALIAQWQTRLEQLPKELSWTQKHLECLLSAPRTVELHPPLSRLYQERSRALKDKAITLWQKIETARLLSHLRLDGEAKALLSDALNLAGSPKERAMILADLLSWAKDHERRQTKALSSVALSSLANLPLKNLSLQELLLLYQGFSTHGDKTGKTRIVQELQERWEDSSAGQRLQWIHDRLITQSLRHRFQSLAQGKLSNDERLLAIKLALRHHEQESAWGLFYQAVNKENTPESLARRLLPLLIDFRETLVSPSRGAVLSLDLSQAMVLYLHKASGDSRTAFSDEKLDQLAALIHSSPAFNAKAQEALRTAAWRLNNELDERLIPLVQQLQQASHTDKWKLFTQLLRYPNRDYLTIALQAEPWALVEDIPALTEATRLLERHRNLDPSWHHELWDQLLYQAGGQQRGRLAFQAALAAATQAMENQARDDKRKQRLTQLRKTLKTTRDRLYEKQSTPLTPFRVVLTQDSRRRGFGSEELLEQTRTMEHLLALCLDEQPGTPPLETRSLVTLVTDEDGLMERPQTQYNQKLSSKASHCLRNTLSLLSTQPLGQSFQRARFTMTVEPDAKGDEPTAMPSEHDSWNVLLKVEKDLDQREAALGQTSKLFHHDQEVYESLAGLKLDQGPEFSRLLTWLRLQGKDRDAKRIQGQASWSRGLRLMLFCLAGIVALWFIRLHVLRKRRERRKVEQDLDL